MSGNFSDSAKLSRRVPLYTWHKVHAGLLDAHALCGSEEALAVARGMADYLVGVLAGLDDARYNACWPLSMGGSTKPWPRCSRAPATGATGPWPSACVIARCSIR